MKFNEYILEMARPTHEPLNSNIRDRKSEWEKLFRTEKRFIKLIQKNIPKYKLYRETNTYILTNKKDEYIAHIDTHEIDVDYDEKRYKALGITDGNSNVRGAYIVLLIEVLGNSKQKFIFSDKRLSDGEIKFYKKILKGGPYDPFVLINKEVQKPQNDIDYFDNNSYQIGFSLLDDFDSVKEEFSKGNIREKSNIETQIAVLYSVNKEL